MPLWREKDHANNSPSWGPALVKQHPNTVNQDSLYQDKSVGVFAVTEREKKDFNGVASLTIVTPGHSFTARPTLAIGSSNAVPANTGVNATALAWGGVVNAVANEAGAGEDFLPGDLLTVAGGASADSNTHPAVLRVETVDTGGEILTVSIVEPGKYVTLPTLSNNQVETDSENGINAGVDLVIGISAVEVTNPGIGYTSTTTVTVGGTGGTAGNVVAQIGKLESSQVTHKG